MTSPDDISLHVQGCQCELCWPNYPAPKPVRTVTREQAMTITAESLKRWGCETWSDEEREELARLANDRQLVEPTSGWWPELKEVFYECMA